MGLTVSTLTPAIEKAKNVATESYVDSTVNTASAALEAAYIEYNNTVKQALIDGEISDAEATAIAAAETKVNDAKTLLNATIVTASNTALSNANAYTNSAISGSGFVLPSGVAAAVNSNTTTINGSKITTGSIAAAQIAAGTITADKISTYNLTASNATIQNGMISNAMIADASITNAKIADAQITTAKIGDAQITNAKIGTASIDTLKIQGEAVVVTRYAEGVGDRYQYQPNFGTIYMYYTPNVSHGAVFNFSGDATINSMALYINGVALSVGASNINSGTRYTYLYAGTAYTIALYGVKYNYSADDVKSYEPRYKHLTMIGAKR